MQQCALRFNSAPVLSMRKKRKAQTKRSPATKVVERPLAPRVLRFIDEYMVDLNGKQAAIRAGYAARSAEMTASRLIRNDKFSAEIEKRQAARAETLSRRAVSGASSLPRAARSASLMAV